MEDFLKENNVWDIFQALPPSHQREYEKWISEAKKEDTRQRRLEKMVRMLTES